MSGRLVWPAARVAVILVLPLAVVGCAEPTGVEDDGEPDATAEPPDQATDPDEDTEPDEPDQPDEPDEADDVDDVDDADEADEADELAACELIPPRELPDGSDPGEPREPQLEDDDQRATWGEGEARVTQATGQGVIESVNEEDLAGWEESFQADADRLEDHEQLVEVDGKPRVVMPVGDPPLSQIQIRFERDDCPYIVWVGPALETDEAIDYAERF